MLKEKLNFKKKDSPTEKRAGGVKSLMFNYPQTYPVVKISKVLKKVDISMRSLVIHILAESIHE